MAVKEQDNFYLRYYVGHQGKFGHDFLEFQFTADGKLVYAYSSAKNAQISRRQSFVHAGAMAALKRLVAESLVTKVDATAWPKPDAGSHQELEVTCGEERVAVATRKGATVDPAHLTRENQGLKTFDSLVDDLKGLFFSLVSVDDYRTKNL